MIAILSPTFYKSKFDIICTPSHDKNKFNSKDNVIFYEGSLVTVSLKETREDVVMIAIGGKNKHYIFDQDHIYSQMEYFYPLIQINIVIYSILEELEKYLKKYHRNIKIMKELHL